MNADNPIDDPISELLAAPFSPDWTVEGLAEQLLRAVANRHSEEGRVLILDSEATTNRQSRRILRPLLACLATKSAAEAGTSPNLYGGHFLFKRPDSVERPVWILGMFENRPGAIRVVFHRSYSPPEVPEARTGQPLVLPGRRFGPDASRADPLRPIDELPTRIRSDRSFLADKRRRAEKWAADYAKDAAAPVTVFGRKPTVFPQDAAVAMCYEIGKIYRDDWSHADAERLASTLPTRGTSIGGAVGAFLRAIPFLGPLVAGAAIVRREHNLLSTAQLIINHFESER